MHGNINVKYSFCTHRNENVMGIESLFRYLVDVDTHGDERFSSRYGRFFLSTYSK